MYQATINDVQRTSHDRLTDVEDIPVTLTFAILVGYDSKTLNNKI